MFSALGAGRTCTVTEVSFEVPKETGALAVQLTLCGEATASTPVSVDGRGEVSQAVRASATVPFALCVWFAVAAARRRVPASAAGWTGGGRWVQSPLGAEPQTANASRRACDDGGVVRLQLHLAIQPRGRESRPPAHIRSMLDILMERAVQTYCLTLPWLLYAVTRAHAAVAARMTSAVLHE